MDKPNDPDAIAFTLPGYGVLALEGQDALAFAQGQFMSDVASLGDGHWHWSGWLTPKGRLVALFALLRVDESTLWLVLPDADPAILAAQLARFVFRAKVVLRARDDLTALAMHAAPALARLGAAAVTQDGTELDMGSPHAARTLRIGPAGASRADGMGDAQARWRAVDLAHGLPRLDATQAERWTPQQLSLERLQAYSVRKGCYPGQEIVARTHFLGQAKRGLVRLQGPALAVDAECRSGDAAVGVVIATAGDEALAVLAASAADAPLTAGGASCEILPLLDGLGR